ncbi:hypothetical protein BDZ45DRAFT_598493 [Acephala macrosclerotiorum]|nr:hypothetical protein BDZ45DRAFT_598493 [Acephala macrosclerotiorum]
MVNANESLPKPEPESSGSAVSKTTATLSKSYVDEDQSSSARPSSPEGKPSSAFASLPATNSGIQPPRASNTAADISERISNALGQGIHPIETSSKIKNQSHEQDLRKAVLSHPAYQQLHKELGEAQQYRTMLENELAEKNADLDEVRKGWRKAANKLNKIRVHGQGFYQVTDQYLIDKTCNLRYNIRNFSIQYFEGELMEEVAAKPTKFLELYIQPTTPGTRMYEAFFDSPRRCPSLIQAFLWRVLVGSIFNQLRWAGDVAAHVWTLSNALRPKPISLDSRPESEAERKFQIWKATTNSLLLDTLELKEGGSAFNKLEHRKQIVLNNVLETIRPYARKMDDGFQLELSKIMSDAVNLDIEISKQVAIVTWDFEHGQFDPSSMELGAEESPEAQHQEVQLVVAPGLKKRGKSTGENFKVENTLLLTIVSCEPIL